MRIGCRGSTRSRRRRSRASRRVRAPSCWSSTRTDTSSTRHPSSTTARRRGSSPIAAMPRVCSRGCARCASGFGSTPATRARSTPSSAARAPRSTVSPLPRPRACRWSGRIRGRASRPAATRYAAVEPHPGAERDWAEAIVTRAEEERIADAAAAGELALAGLVAADALRIAAWRPRWANEVDERALPHELDWLRTAVHLEKGCYRGQETVAKVHNLGHPPRRLVALQLDGSDSRAPVARRRGVRSARTPSASSPRRRCTSRRDRSRSRSCAGNTAVDAALVGRHRTTADIVAAQEVIVPPEAGATANIPRLPRLGRRAALRAPWARPRSRPRRPSPTGWRDAHRPATRVRARAGVLDRDPADRGRRDRRVRLRALRARASGSAAGRDRDASRASGSSATRDRAACSRPCSGCWWESSSPSSCCSSRDRAGGSSRSRSGLTLVVARFLSAAGELRDRGGDPVAHRHGDPGQRPVPASRRRHRRRHRGAAGDRAHPAHSAARQRCATGAAVFRAMDSRHGHAGAGAAPRRPAAGRARSREGAGTAAARGRLVDARSTPGIAIARISPFLRRQPFGAAAPRAHPSVDRPRDAQSPGHRAPGRLPLRRRRGAAGRGRHARRPRARRPSSSRSRSTTSRSSRSRAKPCAAWRAASTRRSCCPTRRWATRTSSPRCGRSRSTC